jgi:ATP-dependent exoDNAse (exonuclease V) beta subunit
MVSILRLGVTYYDNQRFYKILRRQIYLLGLFSEACTHIDEYCRENEAFLLGDTNSLLRKVICEVETPFVYERIGYTINNFLIDEFQDTSEMQWENLRPLVMESLARNNANLIIGDEKQCIYRFRNSNPELLGSEVEESTLRRFGDKDMIHVSGVKISENTNWRSSREVVMFNNTLFAYLSRLADSNKHSNYASKTYSALIQQVASKHSDFHGYVKMLFGPDSTAEQRWDEKSQLNYLGAEIDRQLSAGYKPKDIAILVRTHKQGQMVIAHLLEMMEADNWTHGHLKIVSSDALEISSSPAVQFIIGHLRLTTTPQYIADTDKPPVDGLPTMKPNPEYLRNRLIHRYELSVYDEVDATDADGNPVLDENGNQLKRRVSAEEALMKAIEETTPELKEKDAEALKQKFDQETTKTGDMDCPGIFSITEKIIQTLLPEQSREKECSFISAFQDLVLDFEERGESDVESFLNWWDSRGRFATLPAPEGQNAINVMTIHQSKGLEFKCVHLPFFNQQLVKFKGEGWYQLSPGYFPGVNPECIPPYIPLSHSSKFSNISALADQANLYEITQLIDGLNVAYVAFTRAVSELIVYSNPDTGRGENFGTYLLDAASNCNESALQAINLTEEQAQWVMPLQPFFRTLDNGESELIIGEPTVNVPTADKAKQTTGRSTKPLYPLSSPNAADCGLPESFDAEIPYNDVLEEYRIEQPADMVLPQDLEQQGVFDINNERHVGNFLHGALSSVRHLRDLPLAVERAAYRLNIPKYQWRPYLDMLSRSLQDERIKPWFEAYEQLMAERPLTAEDGLRRPDRVVVMPGGEVVVIDYKFGKPARKYEHQVREYMDLLADCGYTNIRGYIFFPMTSALFEVR